MSTKDDASLDPGREPQHQVPGYRGSIHPEELRIRERPKALGKGARKPRYYQPGQLDLVTRYWNRVVKPVGPWGG